MSGVHGDSGLASVTRLINGLATCIEGFSREGLASSYWCPRFQAAAPQPWLRMESLPGPSSRFGPFLLFLLECETISSFHSRSMAGRLMNLRPAPKPWLPRMSPVHSEVPTASCRKDNRRKQKTQGCAVKFPAAAAAPFDPKFHYGNDPSPPAPPEPVQGPPF